MMNMSLSKPAFLSAALGGVLLLSACAGTTPADPTPSLSGPSTVRLITHDSFAVSEVLIADLKAQTGITLEIVTGGDAGQVVAGAILSAGAPSGDVLFGIDNSLIAKAIDAGVFEPFVAANLGNVLPTLRDDTAEDKVTPIDYGDVCINMDEAWFAQNGIEMPRSLDDLRRPEYKDLLVVQDPATSSPGQAFMLATISRYGDSWEEYWQALRDNGVKVAGSWSEAYEGSYTAGGGKGDRPLVVSYATSPPAEIVYAGDPKPVKPYSVVMTDGCYRQVEYAGVLAGTSNPAGAKTVINWLLSPAVQADVPLSMFVFPALAGVIPPKVFVDFAAPVKEPLQRPSREVAEKQAQWLDEWGQVMGR
jgi:thiamine transport system substrate-binding protein